MIPNQAIFVVFGSCAWDGAGLDMVAVYAHGILDVGLTKHF